MFLQTTDRLMFGQNAPPLQSVTLVIPCRRCGWTTPPCGTSERAASLVLPAWAAACDSWLYLACSVSQT